MGMEIPEIYFQSLNCAFMRIQAGCQGRQRRLFSLDNQPEYAYTLTAIDKLESKKYFLPKILSKCKKSTHFCSKKAGKMGVVLHHCH